MPYYAHAVIELENRKIQRDAQLTDEEAQALPGFEELVEGGALNQDPYDPKVDEVPMPDTVEIEGVTYIKVSDGAEEAADVRTA